MVRNTRQYFLFKQELLRIFAPVVFNTALFYGPVEGAAVICLSEQNFSYSNNIY